MHCNYILTHASHFAYDLHRNFLNILVDLHYLDELISIVGSSPLMYALSNLNTIKDVCLQLDIPFTLKKLEGPSQSLTSWTFSWTLNAWRQGFSPDDNLLRILTQLHSCIA